MTASSVRQLRVGVLSPINKLDPRDAVDYVSAVVLAQIFETPYAAIAGETTPRPVLFEPLRSEDGKGIEYSAAVRPNMKFSDGTPLTPDIAARSLRGASVLANKAKVEVRADRVWFTLAQPNPRFDLTLTQSSCAIVLDKAMQLFGTGPFVFDQRPNIRLLQTKPVLKLVRNAHHQGTVGADELEFIVFPADADGTPAKLIEALRRGEVDVTTVLSTADLVTHRLTGHTAVMQPASSTAILFFNAERKTLSRDVRRGLAAALDLHEIASRAYDRNPAAYIASSVLPPSMGRSSGLAHMDRTEALRLIEAGGAKGARLTMAVPWAPRPYLPKPVQVAAAIQKQLAEVGVTVTLAETKTSDEFFESLYAGRFDLALAGWIADTPDPADFFEALLWSKMIGGENHSNYSRWKDELTDAAVNRFRAAPTDTNRNEVHRLIKEQAPFVPLLYGQSTVVHIRGLRRVMISPTGVLPLADVTMGA
jgi:ABC-type transport system substrate-binding protein